MRFQQLIHVLSLSALALLAPNGARETEAAQTSSEIMLEVSGMASGEEVTVTLDLTALQAIGTTEIVTSTIWTDGVHQFSGVLLRDLLNHVGVDGRTVQATAINDYAITIPFNDAMDIGPLVAFEMDGKPMSRRAKGPLWIVYPFDSSAKYRTETIYARSIWQLNRIDIIK